MVDDLTENNIYTGLKQVAEHISDV